MEHQIQSQIHQDAIYPDITEKNIQELLIAVQPGRKNGTIICVMFMKKYPYYSRTKEALKVKLPRVWKDTKQRW